MPNYRVAVESTVETVHYVEAANEAEAKDAALLEAESDLGGFVFHQSITDIESDDEEE